MWIASGTEKRQTDRQYLTSDFIAKLYICDVNPKIQHLMGPTLKTLKELIVRN